MNVSRLGKQAFGILKKHSPTILTGIGIAGMIATVVMSVQATPKALHLIEEAGYEKGSDENPIMGNEYTPLTPMEMVKTAWKCYIPAAITGGASIACLIGANSVNARRNAALLTAYTISETAAKEYREKVVEAIGEKKEHAIRDEVAKEQIAKNPVSKSEVIVTGDGETRCFDPWNSRYFDSDPEKIRRGVNDLNYQLINEGIATLNDFYYSIGLDESKSGAVLGWNINRGGQVQLRFSAQVDENERPCLVLDFTNPPTYDFANY